MRSTPLLAAGLGIPLSLTLMIPGGAVAVPEEPAAAPAAGTAFFLTEPSSAPAEDVARDVLRLKASEYGVSAADLADLQVLSQHTSDHNGVTYVNLVQHYAGRQVYGGVATVSVTKDGSVLHVAESLVPNLREATGKAALDAAEAVSSAAEGLDLEAERPQVLEKATGAEQETTVSAAGIADEEIPARLVWQMTDDGLRLAWELVIDEAGSDHLWQVMVDAQTGKTLTTEDWTDHHGEGHLTGLARSPQQFAGAPAAATSVLPGSPVPVADGSSYRVLAFPKESPNDGDRELVTQPADQVASPFGWHDTDGVPGPEHTITRGNNVHAYTDQDANNVPDPGSEPDGGAGLDFDFPMDLSEHAQTYRAAAVTNLFYANNVIHDVLYRYGFDEVSGNFQVTNYTGEGVGGDDVRAEAADGGGTNNANFSTPAADGGRPRMQMYLWPGNQFGPQSGLTLGTGSDAVTYGANYARFTPAPTNAGFPGVAVVVDDACVPFAAPGAVVITARTTACSPHAQVSNAEAGGAVAVVITHNIATQAAPILSGSMDPAVGIPAISVSTADGEAIRAQVAAGATSASVHKMSSHPGIRDGDLENGIIIHEYGHGVSNRLTGGLNINCLSGNEQMGEGWSDYLAITMLLDPALDDPEQARGMGPYALFQPDRGGAGIRPAPYSRNMAIQPFTYDRIKTSSWITGGSLAAPHGIGHAWAATLWDLNWNLMDRHGFTDDLYAEWDEAGNTRAMQYVMDGLKLQGCGPGFVAGRNGILAADAALGGTDSCVIWSTFARRGLGYSAVQGTTNRDDNSEAFDVPPTCDAPGAGLVGAKYSNDALNVVDAGDAAPVQFNLGGDLGLDVLRDAHSPMSQQISCETREPLQFAVSVPTETTGQRALTYNARQERYQYNWQTDEAWGGTCRQLIITLDDGTQHRADFRFEE
ncbi:M36 family metallopeptidase [Ornithinimicrobium cerasi]|uniref:PA domain-containing protein n=1 Tax=Ornithinimicrobium cerasi TaxID=2248773 RepID=A0A285VLM0_9MICO|nr:M36 family metallopeptidase [Ornithinimicrobium cerasi]SOC54458.1 PA domain-containing protein [Ornithinimicrobium cerasi]